ncbi:cell division protein ZapB [bacterium]|nr:cell division protein ZapB [bacterium]
MNINQFTQEQIVAMQQELSRLQEENARLLEEKEQKENKNNVEDDVSEDDVMAYLNQSSPIFTDYEDLLGVQPRKPVKMIRGKVQSGKSDVICGIVAYNALVEKISTVVIVRNLTGDYKQLASKFEEGGSWCQWGIPVIYCCKPDTLTLGNALRGETPSLIIALAHCAQVRSLNSVLSRVNNATFDMIVDEADDLAYKVTTQAPYISQLNRCRPRARQTYLVSATVFTMLFKDFQLTNDAVYDLQAPENYKGVTDITFNEIEFDVRNIGTRQGIQFYENFINEEMFGHAIPVEGHESEHHPIIVLHKTTQKRFQYEGLEVFATNPKLSDFWCTMTYNGDGIQIYHEAIKSGFWNDAPIVVGGVTAVVLENGILEFKKVVIQTMLQWLRDHNEGGNTFTHICIIAGRLGDRGVNFCSTDFKWHLTHQVLYVTKTTTAASLVQSIRLCGRYNDDIPLNLYTTRYNANNLVNTLSIQDCLMNGCVDAEQGLMRDLYRDVAIYTDVVPKNKLCKKSEYKLRTIVRPSGFRRFRMDTRQSDKDWGIANLIKNVKRAIQNGNDTIVVKIIKFLWDEESKTFKNATKEDLVNACGITTWSHYTTWNKRCGQVGLLEKANYVDVWLISEEVSDQLTSLLQ